MSCNTCDGRFPRHCPDPRHKKETFRANLQEGYGPPIWEEQRVSKVWPLFEAFTTLVDKALDIDVDCCINGMRDHYHSSYGCPESIENGCPGHEDWCECEVGQAFKLLHDAGVYQL